MPERWMSLPNPCPPCADREWIGGWCDERRRLTVLVSRDVGRWHLSIASADRDPSWTEIKEARYRFVPDEVYMMMPLPPSRIYVNTHEHCFHLWEAQELKTIWLMEQM